MRYTVVALPLCWIVDIIKNLLNIALKSLWVRSRNGCSMSIGCSATFKFSTGVLVSLKTHKLCPNSIVLTSLGRFQIELEG